MKLLAEHPEWREELRRSLLSDDFLALPQIVRELAEAQKRTEARLDALTQRVEELAEAQKRTEYQVHRLTDRVAKLDGRLLEMEYQRKASSYFGRLIKRAQVVDVSDLEDCLEPHLPPEKLEDILRLDLVLRGQLRPVFQKRVGEDVWLAVEVSVMIDRQDVERALRRADYIRESGLQVIPVVAGENITEGAEKLVEKEAVVLLTDGAVEHLEDAVNRYVTGDRKQP